MARRGWQPEYMYIYSHSPQPRRGPALRLGWLVMALPDSAKAWTLCECIFHNAAAGLSSSIAAGQLQLLLADLDPNCEAQRSRQRHNGSPLHVVAQLAGPLSLTALLQARARVDALDAHGRTPLHLAAMRGTSELVDLLVQAVRHGTLSGSQLHC